MSLAATTPVFYIARLYWLLPQNSMALRPFKDQAYCIRIRTRGGIYGKIWLEPEGLPEVILQWLKLNKSMLGMG